jgi:hypothetical protein
VKGRNNTRLEQEKINEFFSGRRLGLSSLFALALVVKLLA